MKRIKVRNTAKAMDGRVGVRTRRRSMGGHGKKGTKLNHLLGPLRENVNGRCDVLAEG